MSPAQIFHLPAALKRTRPAATDQYSPTSGQTKVEHILGVTEADINTARNQSVSSGATHKYRDTSFSDDTTQLGTSLPQDGNIPQIPELKLKASSILLHEEYRPSDCATSIRSEQLRRYDSSSTLQSHYEPQKAPLAVSQQTSDSSRRDFALRKGKPVVINSTTKEDDSLQQFKLLSNSNIRPNGENKKLSKSRPMTGHSASRFSMTPAEKRPSSTRSTPPTSVSSNNKPFSKPNKGVRFMPPPLPSSESQRKAARKQKMLLDPMDPASVKVNVRRPKTGAKHWFDGHLGDSSDEEIIDEPEFNQSFANGLESTFRNGQFGNRPAHISTRFTNTSSSGLSSVTATPRNSSFQQPMYEQNGIVPRINVLNAKASKASLSKTTDSASSKRRTDRLAEADLSKSSVLNLSSSEDEEDGAPTPQPIEMPQMGPRLRDSVADAFSHDQQIELGTAQAINPSYPMIGSETPHLGKPTVIQHESRDHLRMPVPRRGSSLMLSYLNDQVESQPDLLASFPATPTESVASPETSFRGSMAFSDTGSMESRRMMSLTKQEESLIAAMRLKKAAVRYNTTQHRRLETLRELEQQSTRSTSRIPGSYESRSMLSLNTSLAAEPALKAYRRRSRSGGDTDRIRASGTTFQTTTSQNPSRLSRLNYRPEPSADRGTHLSLSSSEPSIENSASPSHFSLNTNDKRLSRETYFSTSSASYRGHSRTVTGTSSNVVALDDLGKVPNRDEIPSQEFIDWPYQGWEHHAKMGVAH